VGVCTGTLNTDPTKGPLGTCQRPATLRCSGTLVAQNLVLTARHCVEQVQYDDPNGAFCSGHFITDPPKVGGTHVTTASSVMVGTPSFIDVASVVVPPAANACDDDVALLVLAQPITDVRPAWVDLVQDVNVVPPFGHEVAIVGRGDIAYALDPATLAPAVAVTGDLQRRILRDIPFVCAGTDCSVTDITSPPTNSFTLSAGQFLVAPSGAPGDSGSGVLQNATVDFWPSVLGVFSADTFATDGTTSGGIAVGLKAHAGWISQAARDAARQGGYCPPAWALLAGR
jgi:hypothetical protein